MNIEKMWEEFEVILRDACEASGIDAPDLRISPCVLDDGAPIYINDMTQACWWSYRKGWQASRELLVIELPKRCDKLDGIAVYSEECDFYHRHDVREAIEAAGLKVKS